NVAGAFAGAFGALLSGLPTIVAARLHFPSTSAQRCVFFVYSAIALISIVLYRSLSVNAVAEPALPRRARLAKSRRIVMHLAALFSLDAFSGGLIVQAMFALWLFRRFGMSTQAAGVFFFASNLAGSMSQFVSSKLAIRIGRIRTMVYTHLPSNCFLFLAGLMRNVRLTLFFLLFRSALSQMYVSVRP